MQHQEPDFRSEKSRPEDPFVTLVAMGPLGGLCQCFSFDTQSLEAQSELSFPVSMCCSDTADDAFSSIHGCSVVKPSAGERATLGTLIEGLREAARLPLGMRVENVGALSEEISGLEVVIRMGPLVESPLGVRAMWVEVFCLDTGEGLIPDLLWLVGKLPPELHKARDERVWERFSEGTARLVLEFSADKSGDLSMCPWLSVECREEALRHMSLAVRSGGLLGPSVLHAAILQGVEVLLEEAGAAPREGIDSDAPSSGPDLEITRIWRSTDDSMGYEFRALVAEEDEEPISLGRFEARFGMGERGSFGLLTLEAMDQPS